jgi:hypothetical protein
MQKVGGFKSLPRVQVSDDLLWGINRTANCFLRKSQGLTLSVDPTNLFGLNLKRDSGITSEEGIGITINIAERRVKERKAKKRAPVVRFDLNLRKRRQLPKSRLVALPPKAKTATNNNSTFSSQKGITARSLVKVITRGIKNYRPDLQRLALIKVRKLHKAKKIGKALNKKDAKRQK